MDKIRKNGFERPEGFTGSELHKSIRRTRGFESADAVHSALDQKVQEGGLRKEGRRYYAAPAPTPG
jgi:hypothetical protein